MRSSKSSPTAGRKLTKFVRFLDHVEIVPSTPFSHYDSDEEEEEDDASISSLDEKRRARSPPNDYEHDILDDSAVSSSLGRAGSLDGPSSRSSSRSSKHLSIPTTEHNHLSIPQEFHPPSPPPSSLTAGGCASKSHRKCVRQTETEMLST